MIAELEKPPKYYLNLDLCEILFHEFRDLVSEQEPIPPFHTRFPCKLENILGSIRAGYGDQILYPSMLDVTVAYFQKLIFGHPFQNGNKRMSVLFTHSFLLINGLDFALSQSDFFRLAIEIFELEDLHNDQLIQEVLKTVFAQNVTYTQVILTDELKQQLAT